MGKSEELKIDGRKKDFKEKLNKLGYKKEESDFDVETLIENSDKKDAKEMADLVKELEPKIKDKELQAQVYDLAMEKYKNKTRAKKIASYV
jgi:DNA helicase IV